MGASSRELLDLRTVRCVGIVAAMHKRRVAAAVRDLLAWLAKRGVGAVLPEEQASALSIAELGRPLTELGRCADLVLSMGGDGTLLAAVRQYNHGGEDRVLVVDPQRFAMRTLPAQKVLSSPAAPDETWRATPFSQALARQTSPPYPLQNDGLREAESAVSGFFLTADLCPSRKPLDYGFVKATMALPQKPPVPIALMVSGLWIRGHQTDLAWLKEHTSSSENP